MRQVSNIFIVVIVNILILAHVVIPHHHHGITPCFALDIHHSSYTATHTADDDVKHGGTCSHEQRSGHEKSCALDQLVIFDKNDHKTDSQCSICLHDHLSHLLQAVLFNFSFDFSSPERDLRFRKPPFLIGYHSIFASRSLGLRAPPMV